jgi:hypothetical protein
MAEKQEAIEEKGERLIRDLLPQYIANRSSLIVSAGYINFAPETGIIC